MYLNIIKQINRFTSNRLFVGVTTWCWCTCGFAWWLWFRHQEPSLKQCIKQFRTSAGVRVRWTICPTILTEHSGRLSESIKDWRIMQLPQPSGDPQNGLQFKAQLLRMFYMNQREPQNEPALFWSLSGFPSACEFSCHLIISHCLSPFPFRFCFQNPFAMGPGGPACARRRHSDSDVSYLYKSSSPPRYFPYSIDRWVLVFHSYFELFARISHRPPIGVSQVAP